MAVTRKRRIKGRAILPGEGKSGDIQISSSGATIRLTWMTAGIAFLVVMAVIGIIRFSGVLDRESAVPGPAASGDKQTETAAVRPAENRAPAVLQAMILPSDPSADTALEVKYEANDPDGDPLTVQFRWFVDEMPVQEGPSSSLQPGAYRQGSLVYAEVMPADQYSSGISFKTPPITIASAASGTFSVSLSPELAYRGSLLTATLSAPDPEGEAVEYQYQWRVNGSPAGEPSGQSTFDTSSLNKRDSISVLVTSSAGRGAGGPASSNTVILQNRGPEITSSPQTGVQGNTYLYQVAAKDPDGDSIKYRLEKFPEGMTIDPSTGLIRWALPKGVLFSGRNEVEVMVRADDGDGGADTQEYSIILTDFLVY